MNILVTGRDGQLGHDVLLEGKKRGHRMIGTGRSQLDFTDETKVQAFLALTRPDAMIHCGAYTAVDLAEQDEEACRRANVDGTRYLAAGAQALGIKLMYISTDYVFDGQGETPFTETDQPAPINVYGQTKYEGEQAVRELVQEAFIVRVSWVFGLHGHNFVKTMLRLAESKDTLRVVNDQHGSPTYTADLAVLLLDMIATDRYGIYHATNEGFCSWAAFAAEIFRQAGAAVRVEGIATADYPTAAVRPANSRLSKQKLEDSGFGRLPAWEDAVGRFLNSWSSKS